MNTTLLTQGNFHIEANDNLLALILELEQMNKRLCALGAELEQEDEEYSYACLDELSELIHETEEALRDRLGTTLRIASRATIDACER